MLAFLTWFRVIPCNMFDTNSTLQRLFMNQLYEALYSLQVYYISNSKKDVRDFRSFPSFNSYLMIHFRLCGEWGLHAIFSTQAMCFKLAFMMRS
jgi:hypothetical protein